METIILNSVKKGIAFSIVLLFLSVNLKAQDSSSFFGKLYESLMKDSQESFYIIGGVFGLGVLVFIISKIASKYAKEEAKNDKRIIRPVSHRNHHHHRIVKKST